jgi:HTH-type transcriptional regulator / antitoxin HipB
MYHVAYMDKSYHLQKLGEAFRAARQRRGLTQQQVANLASLTRLTVIRIEDGRDSVAIRNHARLAAALGLELSISPRTRPTLEELGEMQ